MQRKTRLAVLFTALALTPPERWWRFLAAAFVIQVPILAYLHLPLWWNLALTLPLLVFCWWVVYRSGWV